jgi:AraC family transcriptional regulator
VAATTDQNVYLERINLVIDHITSHLDEDLSLATLAQIAGFSPFHFHRLFTLLVGEPLNEFVNRVRVERAALLLRAAPDMRVLDAALACGYNSASGFSRAFRKQFGLSPRQWDRQTPLQDRKIGQEPDSFPDYTAQKLAELAGTTPMLVRVTERPAQRWATVRVYDSYRNYEAVLRGYERLMQWCSEQGGDPTTMPLYGTSLDDPHITPLARCRFDWSVAIPAHWRGEPGIRVHAFPACTVASVHVQGDITLLDQAWQYLWLYWLPRSPYQPAHLPAMEIYHRQPLVLGWETYDMDCAIPVEPL